MCPGRGGQEAVTDQLIAEGKQVIEEAVHIESSDGLGMQSELRPGPDLEEFLHRADSAWHGDESIGLLGHLRLADVHIGHDLQNADAVMSQFAIHQLLGDHPDDLSPTGQDCIGENAHQTHVSPAIHETMAPPGQFTPELLDGLCVPRS